MIMGGGKGKKKSGDELSNTEERKSWNQKQKEKNKTKTMSSNEKWLELVVTNPCNIV